MHIPQIIMITLGAINLGIALGKHGEYRTRAHNFWETLISTVIEFAILAWGGFFR